MRTATLLKEQIKKITIKIWPKFTFDNAAHYTAAPPPPALIPPVYTQTTPWGQHEGASNTRLQLHIVVV